MPRQQLIDAAEPDPAAAIVIDHYLQGIADRLPAHARLTQDVAEELRGDLLDAVAALGPESTGPAAAAATALRDFGDEETVAQALRPELAARHARRLGVVLLATGPVVGVCWLAAIYFGAPHATAWRWLLVLVAPVIVIGASATSVTVLSTGRLSRWLKPRSELSSLTLAVAGTAAGVGDVLLLAGCAILWLYARPEPSALFMIAAGASLARLALVGWAASRRRAPRVAIIERALSSIDGPANRLLRWR